MRFCLLKEAEGALDRGIRLRSPQRRTDVEGVAECGGDLAQLTGQPAVLGELDAGAMLQYPRVIPTVDKKDRGPS